MPEEPTAGQRRDWTEALSITSCLPLRVPDREQVDQLTARLRDHVGRLVPKVDEAIKDECHDTADRETARWLLGRVDHALRQGPGSDDRTAAVHLEDLALNCRALAAICSHKEETGDLAPIALPCPPS
ncbi:DUF6415 family natural product biosynthesis protein [Streptomyces sp. H23]|uniref:DUF6415 family natural product biosynthesis protein n=1 Tax=Streptomyces sp. H23 TaxID=2541723 RepID=UPI00106ED45C|nr:DUF6415 family natural product biosynthesis protein [Streptomyces sp. H23]